MVGYSIETEPKSKRILYMKKLKILGGCLPGVVFFIAGISLIAALFATPD